MTTTGFPSGEETVLFAGQLATSAGAVAATMVTCHGDGGGRVPCSVRERGLIRGPAASADVVKVNVRVPSLTPLVGDTLSQLRSRLHNRPET